MYSVWNCGSGARTISRNAVYVKVQEGVKMQKRLLICILLLLFLLNLYPKCINLTM